MRPPAGELRSHGPPPVHDHPPAHAVLPGTGQHGLFLAPALPALPGPRPPLPPGRAPAARPYPALGQELRLRPVIGLCRGRGPFPKRALFHYLAEKKEATVIDSRLFLFDHTASACMTKGCASGRKNTDHPHISSLRKDGIKRAGEGVGSLRGGEAPLAPGVTVWRPEGPCPLRRRKLRASTATRGGPPPLKKSYPTSPAAWRRVRPAPWRRCRGRPPVRRPGRSSGPRDGPHP